MIKSARRRVRLELFDEQQIAAIHEATLQVMERTGLKMPLSAERAGQAQDAGLVLDRESGRLRFPPEVVEQALKRAPQSYTLCARDPEHDLPLDGTRGYLGVDGSATDVVDLQSGELRPSSRADLEQAARLADALPEVALLWIPMSARDCPAATQPLHELEALLRCTTKHVQAMTAVDPENARGSVEIAAAVAGGAEELRRRPIISSFQCSVSPLSYDARSLEAALVFAEAGVPAGFLNMTIGCGTAPATVAGSAVVGNAEVLAGIVLLQLLHPGTPTFYGSCATMMELRRGGITAGGPEDVQLQAVTCQLARRYGLPSSVGTFATGGKLSDWQAGAENTLSGLISQLCGADMMCGGGLLDGARVFSFEQLVLDCELFGMLCAFADGAEVNAETLALQAIAEVGAGGHYLTNRHTLAHMREVWQPTVADRLPRSEWEKRGRPSSRENAHARALKLLERHRPAELDAARAEQVAAIVADHDRRAGRQR